MLTAAMIVRNEEAVLEACLRSLSNLVDEIVVVDTGSTDASRRIARDCGARVHDFPWTGDFSAARNRALDLSSGDWILYIDADERVRPIDADVLTPIFANPRNIAATVRFHPRTGFTAYPEYRLYRNDPRIRFEGAIHETPLRRLFQIVSEDDRTIAPAVLTLDHVGYDADQHRKHMRNLPLLEQSVRSHPGRSYLWWHLGQVRAALGARDEAEAAWLRGVEVVRKQTSIEGGDALSYMELIRSRFVRGVHDMELLHEAEALFPDDFQLRWLRGRILIALRRFDEAVPVFETLLRVDADTLLAACAYDRNIFGLWSFDSLAYCHFALKQFRESERYYALAEQAAPGDLQYRTKRQLAAVRAVSQPAEQEALDG